MKQLMVMALIATCANIHAAAWFNADIANYTDWPTNEVAAGTWTNPETALALGAAPNLKLAVTGDVNRLEFDVNEKVDTEENAAILKTNVKFTAIPEDGMPDPAPNAKTGLTVMEVGGGLAYYGIVWDATRSTNVWVQLTGATPPTTNGFVDVTIRVAGGYVTYSVGDTALTNNASVSFAVNMQGETAMGVASYEGVGEISALSGEREAAFAYLIVESKANVEVESVKVGDVAFTLKDGKYRVPSGSTVNVNFKGTGDRELSFYTVTKVIVEGTNTIATAELPDASYPWEGDGSAANPFVLADKAGFETLQDRIGQGRYAAKCFKLGGDIDFGMTAPDYAGDYWSGLGTNTPFMGVLDGNGHTISGVLYKPGNSTGFLGYVKDATIMNLTMNMQGGFAPSVMEASVKCGAAGLAEKLAGETVVSNCVVKGYIYGNYRSAGFAQAVGSKSLMIDCVNYAAVTSGYNKAAGFAAMANENDSGSGARFVRCTNHGEIVANYTWPTTGSSCNTGSAAGFVAYAQSPVNVTLVDCVSAGAVSATNQTEGVTLHAATFVGGVVGSTITLNNCTGYAGALPCRYPEGGSSGTFVNATFGQDKGDGTYATVADADIATLSVGTTNILFRDYTTETAVWTLTNENDAISFDAKFGFGFKNAQSEAVVPVAVADGLALSTTVDGTVTTYTATTASAPVIDPSSGATNTTVTAESEQDAKDKVTIASPDENLVSSADYGKYFKKTATDLGGGQWNVSIALDAEAIEVSNTVVSVGMKLPTVAATFATEDSATIANISAKPGLYYSIITATHPNMTENKTVGAQMQAEGTTVSPVAKKPAGAATEVFFKVLVETRARN